jgi:hypothetical protein
VPKGSDTVTIDGKQVSLPSSRGELATKPKNGPHYEGVKGWPRSGPFDEMSQNWTIYAG